MNRMLTTIRGVIFGITITCLAQPNFVRADTSCDSGGIIVLCSDGECVGCYYGDCSIVGPAHAAMLCLIARTIPT